MDDFARIWKGLKPYVSPQLWEETAEKLAIQAADARWWRDACVGLFQRASGLPLPSGVEPLGTPIDSLIFRTVASDSLGMPVHDAEHRPVLLPPDRP